MNKLKVLHISYGGLGAGGVASVIHSISEPLQNDFDFHCVVFRKKGSSEERFAKYGTLHRVNCYGAEGINKLIDVLMRPFRMTYQCYKLCRKEKIEIIHVHNGFEGCFFLLGAKLAGVEARIAHAHNTAKPNKAFVLRALYDSLQLSLVRHLSTSRVGCSENACKHYFNKHSYQVIPNAVDLSKFKWAKSTNDEPLKLINVGRFSAQKNQEFIIKVFDQIHQTYINSKLRLVGFGEDENKLRKLINDLALENVVDMIDGRNSNIPDMFQDSDIMIFPSTFEGFGIVLIEAQASGCYCFSSDVVPNETNVGACTCLPLNVGVEGWAKQILEFVKSSEYLKDREHIVKNNIRKFDVLSVALEYKNLYNSLKKNEINNG